MSGRARNIVILGLAAAAIVVAFAVLRPEEEGQSRPAPAGETDAGRRSGDDEPRADDDRPQAARPSAPIVGVRGGTPVGGIRVIRVRRGDTVRFAVRSDAADHVHVHGYDLFRDVGPGRPARFRFRADVTGVFEVELEDRGEQIVRLTVGP